MVIHKKTIIDIATGETLKSVREYYLGAKLALAKGGSPSSTTTTSTALPGWLQPYAERFIGQYQNQVFDPSTGQMRQQQAPQQGVAGFTPDQITAMDQIRSMTGPNQQAALTNLSAAQDTVQGKYLDPSSNPYLTNTYNLASAGLTSNFQNAVMPGTMAAAQRAGQFGSSSMNEAMGNEMQSFQRGLGDLATQIYGGNYQQERTRQLQAMGMMPQLQQATLQPSMALAGIGAQQQGLAQSQLDTGYANQVSQFEMPYNLLSGFGGALGQAGMGAGQSTTRATGSSGGK